MYKSAFGGGQMGCNFNQLISSEISLQHADVHSRKLSLFQLINFDGTSIDLNRMLLDALNILVWIE